MLPVVRRLFSSRCCSGWNRSLLVRATDDWSSSRRSKSTVATAPPQAEQRQVIQFLRLNNLADNPGAVKKKRRVGRGIGSGRGKTCGRGHKGQKARSGGSIHPTFEGGQTKFYKRLPKRGFHNKNHKAPMLPLNLYTLQMYIDMGRIDASQPITLRELQMSGLYKANAIKHGVKLLAGTKEDFGLKQPIDISVSRASHAAITAVEAAGGTVTSVHYNQLALRQLLRPERMVNPIRNARPPPKWQPYYTHYKNRGYLNPAMQMRQWLTEQRPDLQKQFEELRREKQQQQAMEEREEQES